MALLANPEAMRLLAFGARTVTKVVDTGREIGRVAANLAPPGAPFAPSTATDPTAAPPAGDHPDPTARAANPAGDPAAPKHTSAPDPASSPDRTAPPPETPAADPAAGPGEAPEARPGVPEGSLVVPLEAWNRMLEQLGNLHEAGQALAEARERAARAEAVAEFQTERRQVAEAELERLSAELTPRSSADSDDSPATVRRTAATARARLAAWRHRLRS